MVEILCPHCGKEIELEDDASGVFACPYCEGEFEWNIPSNDETKVVEMYGPPVTGGAALRWSMGLIITIFGFVTMLVSFVGMFLGSQVSGIESDLGSGTSLGAGVIIFSFIVGVFGLALAVAGIGSIRRNFSALVACTVLSIIGGLGAIVSMIDYLFIMDSWERAMSGNPIFNLLFWAAMAAGHVFVTFTPRGREMWMQ
ncbi:hypothetical protein OA172_00820 [Euryarchaeota archaeon]|nr:hypothetical protein [Euryarchaeota archaeon]